MPFRDRFVSCVDCDRSFVEFRIGGSLFLRCEGCEGAWVSHQTLQQLFTNMRWDAKVELWPPPGHPIATGDAAISFSVWRHDQHLGEESFDRPVIKIGRLTSSHLRLDDPSVSRMHAVVELSEDGVFIIDLGSADGTYVNFNKVNKARLEHGDMIQIGVFRLDVALKPKASVQPAAPSSGRACPDCTEPLELMRIGDVEVDVCDAHGVWFDRYELSKVLYRVGTE